MRQKVHYGPGIYFDFIRPSFCKKSKFFIFQIISQHNLLKNPIGIFDWR